MSIPKIIHYCWFGYAPKPYWAEKCINSWKKYCPDYKIIEWNEDNFDISQCPLYVKQAYNAKKWAFVTDYARLKIVYEIGGIYMDTDVELKKNLDDFLNYDAYFGFEDGVHINTGLGFGAIPESSIIYEMMQEYLDIEFVLSDGSFDNTPCPIRNTNVLLKHGLKQDDSLQMLEDTILILPKIYLCPISYDTGKRLRSSKTVSVHWFSASWKTTQEKKRHKKEVRKRNTERYYDYFIHIPNRILKLLLGEHLYEKIKRVVKR